MIHCACVKAKAHEMAPKMAFHTTRACVWISSVGWQRESRHSADAEDNRPARKRFYICARQFVEDRKQASHVAFVFRLLW